jgi:hypothetical protein
MDAGRLLNQTILVESVTQGGPPDDMGDPTEESTWATFKGYVWQTSSSEIGGGGVIVTDQREVVLHKSAAGVLAAGGRIVEGGALVDDAPVGGTEYEVEGDPWTAVNPRTTKVEFVHARLRRSSV